jgi:hypothetical protein
MITKFNEYIVESFNIDKSILNKAFNKAITHVVKAHKKLTEDHIIEFINHYVFHNYGIDMYHSNHMYKYLKSYVHNKFKK